MKDEPRLSRAVQSPPGSPRLYSGEEQKHTDARVHDGIEIPQPRANRPHPRPLSRVRERGAARPRRGMILFIVVIVVAMLSYAGFSFVAMLSIEDKAVRVRGAEMQMEQSMASGVELVKYFAANSSAWRDVGGAYDNTTLFRGVTVFDDTPSGGGHARFSIIAPRVEEGAIRGFRFGIENESAKLNLATVLDWERRRPGLGRQALLQLPGMSEPVADAILDWMDPDSVPRAQGAEADYYSTRGAPYAPRNAVPLSLEELLLVRGVTRNNLFGSDTNFDYQVDPDEIQAATTDPDATTAGDPGSVLPWTALLTVCSAERNVTPEGRPRIDLNDPNLGNLALRLTKVFGPQVASFVLAYRQYGPYRGPKPSNPAATFTPSLRVPGAFTLASILDLVGARVLVPTAQRGITNVLDSPLPYDAASLRVNLPRLADYTTVDPGPVLRGRINVNLAPAAVLMCVPGLNDAVASQIVNSRDAPDAPPNPEHRQPTWLFTEGLVDFVTMRALLPYLTAAGDVYRAQVVAYFDTPGPIARAEVVVDATTSPPRQVYWKDMRALGCQTPKQWLGDTSGDQ